MDEGSASSIDEEGRGLHQREGVSVDEVFGLGIERTVEGDDVG